MNIFLWILQTMLTLHTAVGAVWKFSNPEQNIGSLKAIPHSIWLSMSIIELLCSVALIIPAFSKNLGMLAPTAACIITAEMLLFCVLHLASGDQTHSHMIYWLVVAAICSFIAYGRFVLSPFL